MQLRAFAAATAVLLTVTQEILACHNSFTEIVIHPRQARHTAEGGLGYVLVDAPPTCEWEVSTSNSWITINTPSGKGSNSVEYEVSPASQERSGVLQISVKTHSPPSTSVFVEQLVSSTGGGGRPPPPQPRLLLGSTTLTFTTFAGSNPLPQTIAITNSGDGALNWTAATDFITGDNWLTLSPGNGVGDAGVTVRVNSASLPVGTYRATITITAADAADSPQTVTVSLTVSPRPTLVLTPSSLNFVGSPGAVLPQQPLMISTREGSLDWTATASTSTGGNWLSLSGNFGSTPRSVLVGTNTLGLAAGTYQGTITILAVNAANSPQTVTVTLILGTPVIALRPTSLIFTTAGRRDPPPKTLEVQNAGTGALGWTATVAAQSGGNWLSVSPTTAVAPSTITVSVNSAALAAGAYTGTITIAALPGVTASNSPQVVTVGLAVDAPVVGQDGVVNGASFSREAVVVSPGSIASLFGENLAATTATATSVPLPTTLANAQVLVNDIPAPLFYVSPTQINFQMPPGVPGSSARVVVVSNGVGGLTAAVQMAPEAPGIFTSMPGGTGQAAALNEDFSPNSAQNPVPAGFIVQIFATGLGRTNPPATAGQPAASSPLSMTALTPVVLIGDIPAEVLFSGLAPGFAGLYQVNARVPEGTPTGNATPLQIRIGERNSNIVTLAIR